MSHMSVFSQRTAFEIRLVHTFILQVQHVVPEVTIPPEVTPESVTTYIVDSGSMQATCRCSTYDTHGYQAHSRIARTSKPRYARLMSFVSCTPSTTHTRSTAYLRIGCHIFGNLV